MKVTEQDLKNIWSSVHIENAMAEILGLLEYVEKVDPCKTIIEVGCGFGGSARVWEAVLPPGEGMFIGVDNRFDIIERFTGQIETPPAHPAIGCARRGNWEVEWQKDNVVKFKSDRQIYLVIGDSSKPETAAKVKEVLQGRLADFFFHDGIHWHVGPCWDYHWFQHLIRPEGLVCIADCGAFGEDPMSGCQAVWRAFPEPKIPNVKGHFQGMALWIKQEGFVFDAPSVIEIFKVTADAQEYEARRKSLEQVS